MKNEILLELATRWEMEAKEPEIGNGADDAKIGNAIAQGARETKRECADTIRALIKMIG